MPTLRVVFLLALLGASTAAQQISPCKQISVPTSAVTIFNTADLSSKTAKEGQELELRVDTEVRTAHCLLIAKGASARGHVITVTKPKSFGRSGKLELAVDSIQTLEGAMLGSISVQGYSGVDTMKEALSIPGGAGILVAPLFLPMGGGQAEIPAGTAFDVHLSAGLLLDGIPAEPVSAINAHIIIFRTPRDHGPVCIGKAISCFGAGQYMDITVFPGNYKLTGFGPLEVHAGEHVYLRQIPALPEKTLVRTGGGIFEFFLPQMKAIKDTDAEKMRKSQIKGPVGGMARSMN